MAKVLVETSARHLHLSQQDLETLFGEGFELTFKKRFPSPASLPPMKKSRSSAPKSPWA